MLSKNGSKITNMQEYIDNLERQLDELKAKFVVDAELLKQKLLAQSDLQLRTLKEKLEVALKTIESRDSEIELISARVEQLEMSATTQTTAVEEI